MAEHIRDQDKPGYELDYEAKYKAYMDWLDENDVTNVPREKGSYSKGVIVLMFITIIAFTVTCLVFYWNDKTVDPVLIAGVFLCFGFEFGSLAFIKGRKIKYATGKFGDKQLGHVETIEETDEEDAGKVRE